MLKSSLIMLTAIFFFSLGGYVSSFLTGEFLAISVFIMFFISTLCSTFKIKSLITNIKDNKLVSLCLLRGLTLFLSQSLLYLAINKIGIAPALILYNLGPIFLTISFTLVGNQLKVADAILCACCFLGVLVFFNFELALDAEGTFLGIASAMVFAASQFLYANMAKSKGEPEFIIMLVNFGATLSAGAYLLVSTKAAPIIITAIEIDTLILFITMGLATYFNQYFRLLAFKFVDNPNSIVYLLYFSVPFSLLFTYFEGEAISYSQVLGTALILSGALMQYYVGKKKEVVINS